MALDDTLSPVSTGSTLPGFSGDDNSDDAAGGSFSPQAGTSTFSQGGNAGAWAPPPTAPPAPDASNLNQSAPAARDNPEDMFTPAQNLQRNAPWSKSGPYLTNLPADQEQQFQQWVKQNNVNWKPDEQDYDMR